MKWIPWAIPLFLALLLLGHQFLSGETPNGTLISAVKSAGVSADDEFVEFLNAGGEPATLNGWKLVYQSSSGSLTDKFTFSNLVLYPGEYFLLAGAQYSGPVAPDARKVLGLSGAPAGFALRLLNEKGEVRHTLAMGNSPLIAGNGNAAANPGADSVLVRKANGSSSPASLGKGGRDSLFPRSLARGDDFSDFVALTGFIPMHRGDLAFPGFVPTATASNALACPGDVVIFHIDGLMPSPVDGCGVHWGPSPNPTLTGVAWGPLRNSLKLEIPSDFSSSQPAMWAQPLANGETGVTLLGMVALKPFRVVGVCPGVYEPGRDLSIEVSNAGTLTNAYEVRFSDGTQVNPKSIDGNRLVVCLPPLVRGGDLLRLKQIGSGLTFDLLLPQLANGAPYFIPKAIWADRNPVGPKSETLIHYERHDPENDPPENGYPRLCGEGLAAPIAMTPDPTRSNFFQARVVSLSYSKEIWIPWVEDQSRWGNTRPVDSRDSGICLGIRYDRVAPPKPTWVRRERIGDQTTYFWPCEVADAQTLILSGTSARGPACIRFPYFRGRGAVPSEIEYLTGNTFFSIEDEAGNLGPVFVMDEYEPLLGVMNPVSKGIWPMSLQRDVPVLLKDPSQRVWIFDLRGRLLAKSGAEPLLMPPGPCLVRVEPRVGPPIFRGAEVLP